MCVTSGGSGFLLFVWMETDGVFCDFFVETLANSKIMRTFASQTTKRGAWRGKAGLCERKTCENSSVGRARPCQGRGRGFESRFSLRTIIRLNLGLSQSPTSIVVGYEARLIMSGWRNW